MREAFDQPAIEARLVGPFCVAGLWQPQVRHCDVVGVETGVDALQVQEAVGEQRGAHQEDEGQRDLHDYEDGASARACAAALAGVLHHV